MGAEVAGFGLLVAAAAEVDTIAGLVLGGLILVWYGNGTVR